MLTPRTPEELALELQNPLSPYYQKLMAMLAMREMHIAIVAEKICEYWVHFVEREEHEKTAYLAEIAHNEKLQQAKYAEQAAVEARDFATNTQTPENKTPTETLLHIAEIETCRQELGKIYQQQSVELRQTLDDCELRGPDGKVLILTDAEKDKVVKDSTPSIRAPEIIIASLLEAKKELPNEKALAGNQAVTRQLKLINALISVENSRKNAAPQEQDIDTKSYVSDFFAMNKRIKGTKLDSYGEKSRESCEKQYRKLIIAMTPPIPGHAARKDDEEEEHAQYNKPKQRSTR